MLLLKLFYSFPSNALSFYKERRNVKNDILSAFWFWFKIARGRFVSVGIDVCTKFLLEPMEI